VLSRGPALRFNGDGSEWFALHCKKARPEKPRFRDREGISAPFRMSRGFAGTGALKSASFSRLIAPSG